MNLSSPNSKHLFHKAALLVLIFAGAALAPSAIANTVYTYTGTPYTTCYGSYVAGCSSYSLTGTLDLTLSLSQLKNLSDFTIPASDIASFSFTDGFAASLNQLTAAYSLFVIDTNSQGQITNWGIILLSVLPAAHATTDDVTTIIMGDINPFGVKGVLSGNDIDLDCTSATKTPPSGCSIHTSDIIDGGGEKGSSGTWSVQGTTAPTPEPSSLLLLGTGLLGLGPFLRRRSA